MPHLLDSFTQLPILTSRQPLTNSPLSFPSNHPPYVFFPRDLNIACLAAACSAFPGELSVKVSPGFRWRGGGSSEAMGSFEIATLTPAYSKPTITLTCPMSMDVGVLSSGAIVQARPVELPCGGFLRERGVWWSRWEHRRRRTGGNPNSILWRRLFCSLTAMASNTAGPSIPPSSVEGTYKLLVCRRASSPSTLHTPRFPTTTPFTATAPMTAVAGDSFD